jgi:hypothetical protein
VAFWDEIYRLREKNLISRVWKRSHLREHLQVPDGRYSAESISQRPSDDSVSFYEDGIGLDVKKGENPVAWRVGSPRSGEYKLIVDPEDDLDTQEKEHYLALLRAMELRSGWSNPFRGKPVKCIPPCDPPIPTDEWEAMFLEKWDARLNDRP